MKRGTAGTLLFATLALSLPSQATEPEPWADDDGLNDVTRHEFGRYGLSLGAEYRANWLYVNPISLNTTTQRRASWIEHRLRLDTTADYENKVRLVMSIDAMDGVVWGDNGAFGGDPSSNSGTRAAASIPNNTRVGIGYLGAGDDLDPDNYGFVLRPAPPLDFRRLYGELNTPIGVFRVGRQPTTEGMSILVADGDRRSNRFGYSGRGDSVDRILFATKPLEGLKPAAERDRSRDRGFFLIGFYDFPVQNQVQLFGDDLHGAGFAVRFLDPRPEERRRLELQANYAHRWEHVFDTAVHIVGAKAIAREGRFSAGVEGVTVQGHTREVSEALAKINSDPVVVQDVEQYGARAVVRWDEPTWTAYLELDFASSDRNPNPGSHLRQLYFAEDANVGLLLFERILHFDSARSAAASTELLRRLQAVTFPNERVDTEGSFTQAIALFPQFDLRPSESLLLRGGVLAAWAPVGNIDPAITLQSRDGNDVEDDLVNYAGGKPGSFYGVELAGRVRYRWERFLFDLESAVLFPGDALEDQNGQAARSFLLQGRTTFVF